MIADEFDDVQIKMPERISVAVIIPGDVEVLAARVYPGDSATVFAFGIADPDALANLQLLHPAFVLAFGGVGRVNRVVDRGCDIRHHNEGHNIGSEPAGEIDRKGEEAVLIGQPGVASGPLPNPDHDGGSKDAGPDHGHGGADQKSSPFADAAHRPAASLGRPVPGSRPGGTILPKVDAVEGGWGRLGR
jgi:hypothetical protein